MGQAGLPRKLFDPILCGGKAPLHDGMRSSELSMSRGREREGREGGGEREREREREGQREGGEKGRGMSEGRE